jgi:septal ring factor EnvC (AmiA/AmiB activator)
MVQDEQAMRDALRVVVAEAVAPLREQIKRIEKQQQEQSTLLQNLTAQLDEQSTCILQLEGQGLRLDHGIERANHTAAGAHQIVMQAERQMQQEIAALKERLLDLAADVHKLHLIREKPEQKITALKAEVASFQQRLVQLERNV